MSIFTVEFNPTNKKAYPSEVGSKINSVISWGRPKQKLKTTAPRGSVWCDWRNPKGSHALPFSFCFFGSIKRKWGVSDPLENTSGQRWSLPRVKILGAVPALKKYFFYRIPRFWGTVHGPYTYSRPLPCWRRYVSFLPSFPNSYPRRFPFLFFFCFFFLRWFHNSSHKI